MAGEYFTDFSSNENLVKLQTCFNQFQMYGSMLNPLMKRMDGLSGVVNYASKDATAKRLAQEELEQKDAFAAEMAKLKARKLQEKAAQKAGSPKKAEEKKPAAKPAPSKPQYKPRSAVWDMLDDLEEDKSRLR